MNLENIDTIIFDLGGVILNLDYQKTIHAFQELGITDFEEMYTQAQQNDLFDKYETGEISSQHFVNSLLPFVKERTSPNKVVHAWNAMILDFPIERLHLLDALKEKYSTYLLSNTNELHLQEVKKALKKVTERDLESYFTKAYFSHEINLRKPNKEIFEFVCEENSILPSRTLFIDDTIGHVNGSIQSGINGVHLTKDKTLESLFEL